MRRARGPVVALLWLAAASAGWSADDPAGNPATGAGAGPGTTIIGDQDAAVGLFLAPWKNEVRDSGNRPPGLLDPDLAIRDPAANARVVEHWAASRAYRTEQVLRVR